MSERNPIVLETYTVRDSLDEPPRRVTTSPLRLGDLYLMAVVAGETGLSGWRPPRARKDRGPNTVREYAHVAFDLVEALLAERERRGW